MTKTIATLFVLCLAVCAVSAAFDVTHKARVHVDDAARDAGGSIWVNVFNCGNGEWTLKDTGSGGDVAIPAPQSIADSDSAQWGYTTPEGVSSYSANSTYQFADDMPQFPVNFYFDVSYASGGGSASQNLAIRMTGGDPLSEAAVGSYQNNVCFWVWQPDQADTCQANNHCRDVVDPTSTTSGGSSASLNGVGRVNKMRV